MVNCTNGVDYVNETYEFNIEGGVMFELGIEENQLIFIILWILVISLMAIGQFVPKKEHLGRGLAFFMLFIIALFGGVYIAQLFPWYFSFAMITISGFYGLRAFLNLAKAKRSGV